MADACSLCPNYITEATRAPVAAALGQVRSVKKRAASINVALKGLVGTAAADVATIVALIPVPPVLDLTQIVSIIACPLTPLALALDAGITLANLDPKEVYRLVQRTIAKFTAKINADFEAGLESLASAKVVLPAKRFLDDLLRINLSATLLAEAVTIVAFVKTTCPEEFAAGPYQEFEDEITDFSLDGVVPSGLDSDVDGLLTGLQTGETQIGAWRVLAAAPAPF